MTEKEIANIVFETLLIKAIIKIYSRFSAINLHVCILKGYSITHYLNFLLFDRFTNDIDLLIKYSDFELVTNNLKKLNYHKTDYPIQNGKAVSSNFETEFRFINDYGIIVELHTHLVPNKIYRFSTNINMDEVWKEIKRIDMFGQKMYVLSIEDMLIHLCLHLSVSHNLCGEKWHRDIHKLIEKYKDEMDWTEFLNRITRWKIKKGIYYSLYFVKEKFDTPIPEYVLENLKPQKFDWFIKTWFYQIIDNHPEISHRDKGEYLKKLAIKHIFTQFLLIDDIYSFLKAAKEFVFINPSLLKATYLVYTSWAYILYVAHPLVVVILLLIGFFLTMRIVFIFVLEKLLKKQEIVDKG